MAKKNKKNIKINQKIKKYFDDDPFDVGVQRVSAEILSELFATLGIYDIEHTQEVLLKAVRMLWSEADSGFRQDILTFFEANGEIYLSGKPKKNNPEAENRLENLISELDVTLEEEIALYDAFSEIRSKKISLSKLESKLIHIRFEMKKRKIEKALDGTFDIDDSLEFNASLRYKVFMQHFHKILTLNTKPYSYEYLEANSIEEIIYRISLDKEKVVELKQKSIEKFISEIKSPHEYLTDKEIETAFRASPPKNRFDFPLLKEHILQSLIETQLDVVTLSMQNQELLITINEEFKLPYSDIYHPYVLELHIELNSLLETIWRGEPLDFELVLQSAKERVKSIS